MNVFMRLLHISSKLLLFIVNVPRGPLNVIRASPSLVTINLLVVNSTFTLAISPEFYSSILAKLSSLFVNQTACTNRLSKREDNDCNSEQLIQVTYYFSAYYDSLLIIWELHQKITETLEVLGS